MTSTKTDRTTAQKVAIFRGRFSGRTDVYGSRNRRTGDIFKKKYPVTDAVFLNHLLGKEPYGVFPLIIDKTRILVVDFDKPDLIPPLDFVIRAQSYCIPAYVELSKERGSHVWMWSEEQGVPAWKARLVAGHILKEIGKPRTEIFPKQDEVRSDKYGNFIFAPLDGMLVPKGRTVFLDPDDPSKPYPNQWDFLESIEAFSERLLDEIIAVNELQVEEDETWQQETGAQDNRPGDIFNQQGDIRPILNKHGWKSVSCNDKYEYWRRPGKSTGWSASLIDGKIFHVFTTNGEPFEELKSYSLFSAYALLEHGGDFPQAASDLARQGFGTGNGGEASS